MQFSIIAIIVTFAASVSAAPTPSRSVVPRDCEALKCAAALGPTAVSCVSAAIQEGLDPISDAGCLASAANTVLNFPASCSACADQLGLAGKVKTAEDAAESVAGNVGDAVSDAAGKVGDALGSIF